MCRVGRRMGVWNMSLCPRIPVGSHWINCSHSESPEDNVKEPEPPQGISKDQGINVQVEEEMKPGP